MAIGTAYGGKPGTRNPELESMLSVQPLICVPFARHMSRRSGVPIDKVLAEHHFKWARIYLRNDDVVEVHLHPGKYNGEKVL